MSLLDPLLGTLTWNLGTFPLETLLGPSEPSGTSTWNLGTSWILCLEPRNLPEPLLGTLTWNRGTSWVLYLEPLLGPTGSFRNLYLEPRHLLDPLLGTLTWNLGTLQDDCPRMPQGLVWLRPQSFQLLGKLSLQGCPPWNFLNFLLKEKNK